MAVVLIIFVDRIDYRIFTPIYTGARNDNIRKFFLRYIDTDVNKEIVYRIFVLSKYIEDY
jgi:hypothetical protein